MFIIPGKMVRNNKKVPSSQQVQQLDSPKIFSPRVVFTRGSDIAKVIFRTKKKGKQNFEDIKLPEEIDDLDWIKYQGKIISTYHRRINGSYFSSRNHEVYARLNQQLEGIFQKAIGQYINRPKNE